MDNVWRQNIRTAHKIHCEKLAFALVNQILQKSGLYYGFFVLAGVSIYLMNCSVSKSKCEKYHVTGYPTIIMFQI